MSGVWHDEDGQAWLLEMRSTGYALGLADAGAAVRHLYWGPALPASPRRGSRRRRRPAAAASPRCGRCCTTPGRRPASR